MSHFLFSFYGFEVVVEDDVELLRSVLLFLFSFKELGLRFFGISMHFQLPPR